MWFLKGCPRCKGDVEETVDHFGRYRHCLSCGWSIDLGLIGKLRFAHFMQMPPR